jgi:MraZ protein
MALLTGEYDYSLDVKGRVKLPPAFREALAPDQECLLYITRDYDSSLALYSAEEYEQIKEKAAKMDPDNPRDRVWIHRRISSSFPCTVDAQGRIKIPAAHIKGAKLAKGGVIKLVGFLRHVQIWDPEEFERHIAEDTREG